MVAWEKFEPTLSQRSMTFLRLTFSRRSTIRLFSIFLLLLILRTASSLSQEPNSVRLDKLERAFRTSQYGVLSFTEETFRKYIEDAPRSYSMFVLFTAEASICRVCPSMKLMLGKVIKEYDALPSRKKGRDPVYFAEMRLSQKSQSLMTDYGITTVPLLQYFPSGRSQRYPEQLRPSDAYNGGLHPNPMKQFINRKTGSKFRVARGGYVIPFVPAMQALLPAFPFVLAVLGAFVWQKRLWESSYFWLALAVAVYMFSVGGGHYSWIHNAPWAVVSQEGEMRIVERGSTRSQYVAEGFCFALICVCIAALTIVIKELPNIVSGKFAQRVLGYLCLFGLLSLLLALYSLYEMKSPGYLRYSE